ncbi:DUF4123 domain-containing protein [Chromobacterium subtsugae]|uniref:DUF4123 domain-containing protein n=1 Tax=Chromobacterium subtsugae TaxID=251747 RepID=UPI000640FFCE|nr:DUF4123 domain-containing protein [Chromobacterium subtsugae]
MSLQHIGTVFQAFNDLPHGMSAYLLLDGEVLTRKARAQLPALLALFAETGLSSVELDGPQWLDAHALTEKQWTVLDALYKQPQGIQMVTTKIPLDELNKHFQRQLDGWDVAAKKLIWFHFYQATVLPILHRLLDPDLKQVLFGGIIEWWLQKRNGAWYHLSGDGVALHSNTYVHPFHGEVFPLSEEVAAALNQERQVEDIYHWMRQHQPDFVDPDPLQGLLEVEARVLYARTKYGLIDANAMLSWCVLSLLSSPDVDTQIEEIGLRLASVKAGRKEFTVDWLTTDLSAADNQVLEHLFQSRKEQLKELRAS